MADYELQLKIKNAPLLNLMRERGYKTSAELSRAAGVNESALGALLNLQRRVFLENGITPCKDAQTLCDFFGVSPEELAPAQHLRDPLKQYHFNAQIEAGQLQELSTSIQDPSTLLEYMETEERDAFKDMLAAAWLSDREATVLTLRYQQGKTLEQCARQLGVTRERIRQITIRALQKMRDPERADDIKAAAGYYLEGLM